MRRALLLAALLSPLGARAQPAFALRLAYAASMGDAAEQLPVSEAIGGQVPLQVDALWRHGAASAGAYVSWGPGQAPAAACDDGASCSAAVLRLGLEGQWAFAPVSSRRLLPWAGVGVGWERASSRRSRLGSETSWTYSGPDVSFHGGLDWPLGRGFALGPFAELAVGRYWNVGLETAYDKHTTEIVDRAFHASLHLGVRCRLELGR